MKEINRQQNLVNDLIIEVDMRLTKSVVALDKLRSTITELNQHLQAAIDRSDELHAIISVRNKMIELTEQSRKEEKK